jgi:pimeloyl-ACP methyl ester carboxylesterase
MRSVDVDGARLAFLEQGDPSADPIVLLHGYPANHLSWRRQVPALAEHHRVFALDWLGWGESDRPLDLRFDYDTEVARLGRALDALGIDECNLFGHDYGGFLALGFCERHPSRVLRLAILNSRAHRSFVPKWYAIFSIMSLLGRSPLAARVARLLPLEAINRRGMRGAVRAGVIEPEVLDRYLGWISEPDGDRWLVHFFGQYRVGARAELGDRLGEIECPTAIVWGAEDEYLRTEVAEELAAQIPNAELSLINAGHFVMEEAPVVVLDALNRLLGGPSSPRDSQ